MKLWNGYRYIDHEDMPLAASVETGIDVTRHDCDGVFVDPAMEDLRDDQLDVLASLDSPLVHSHELSDEELEALTAP